MVAAGYKPVLFDGLRTQAEAIRNATKGTGIKDSIHCYGAAADLICEDHGWACRAAKCKFFTVLGREAEKLKMVWGGRFTKVDQPHVQGISIGQQAKMRKLGIGPESEAARDELVKAFFA
jgi:hypothetical protein